MLKIEDLTIAFENKIIYENTCFTAYEGDLTVICGKSGTGKSTFIDALLFKHDCQYIYNGEDISLFPLEKKEAFIYQFTSTVYQEPAFIGQLKVKEHISLVQDLYHINDIKDNLMRELRIQNLMDKYPSQLSGGERTRVALFLSLLKSPRILILDEPTASLDNINQESVIRILKNYAIHHKAIVIVSTHDQMLMEESDHTYEIKDKQLNEVKSSSSEDYKVTSKKYIKQLNLINKYSHKMRKNSRLSYKLLMIFISFSIGFIAIAQSINNASVQQIKTALNEFSSREIIVYKPVFEANGYSFYGGEEPFTDEEVEQIKEIEHIERVEWRFDIELNETQICNGPKEETINFKNVDDINKKIGYMTSYDGNHKNKELKIYGDDIGIINQHTYMDNYDYRNAIQKQYHDEGLYISPELFNLLFDENVKDPYLEFNIFVPMYNSKGTSFMTNHANEEEIIPCNAVDCNYRKVKLPVKGVNTNYYLTNEINYEYGIYVSQNTLMKYINQEEVQDTRTIYWVRETETSYFDELPNGLKAEQTIYQTKWKPNAYNVVVDELKNIEGVIKELKSKGFHVESQYFNTKSILSVEESVTNTMELLGTIVLIVCLILCLVMKYMNSKEVYDNCRFLTSLGLSKKENCSLHYNEWIDNWVIQFIIATVFFFVLRFILERSHIAYIRPDIFIFVKIACISFLVEFLYPYIFMKVKK